MKITPLSELLAWKPPPLIPIIESNILVEQSKMIIYGTFGVGKSILRNQMCFNIALGEKFLGVFQCVATGTWSVQLELNIRMEKERVDQYCLAHRLTGKNMPKTLFVDTEHFLKMDVDAGLAQIEALICDRPDIKVLALDPQYKIMSGSMYDQMGIGHLIDRLDYLIFRYNLSVVVVTHTRKQPPSGQVLDKDLGAENILGSVIFPAWADTIIGIRATGAPDEVEIHFNKTRHSRQGIPTIRAILDRNLMAFRMI